MLNEMCRENRIVNVVDSICEIRTNLKTSSI